MFTLRKVFYDGTVSNTHLGDYYMTVRKSTAPEKFAELLKVLPPEMQPAVYAFVVTRGYAEIHALVDGYNCYIVNERGATFERVKNEEPAKPKHERKPTLPELQAMIHKMDFYKKDSGWMAPVWGGELTFFEDEPTFFATPITRAEVLKMIDKV